MYHGANSFAEEINRETIPAGFSCNNPVSGNRRPSEYGRWQSPQQMLPLRLRPVVALPENAADTLPEGEIRRMFFCLCAPVTPEAPRGRARYTPGC